MKWQGFNHQIYHLPVERWKHIAREHPEVLPYLEEIKETVEHPEHIKRSKRDAGVALYYKYFRYIYGGKFILAFVRHSKGPALILTAYITDKIKAGETIWKIN